jgi:nitroreductase
MDAIELLHNRVSSPMLQEPGPTAGQLDIIFRAALRAPDHGAIRPWRFLTVSGENRARLGELYLKAALADDPELNDAKRNKILAMPQRAPLLIVVIAANVAHPKVPVLEQEVSAGCAAQNILHAAFAQGLGAMWRTGDMAYHPVVKAGLGVAEGESIIGYLYLGTPGKTRTAPEHELSEYVFDWKGAAGE